MSLKLGSHLTLYLSANCRPRGYIIQFSEDFSSAFVGRAGSSGARLIILVIRKDKGEYLWFREVTFDSLVLTPSFLFLPCS